MARPPTRFAVSTGRRTVSVTFTSSRRTSAKPTALANAGSNGGVDVASVRTVNEVTSVAGKSTRWPAGVSDSGPRSTVIGAPPLTITLTLVSTRSRGPS